MDKSNSIFDLLNKRFEFSELVKDLNVPEHIIEGDINSLRWFVHNGHKSNRFKENYEEALSIAKTILKQA